MKSYHINMGTGLEGLTLMEHDMPRLRPHEALVRVHAVSLNYRELMIMLQGRYPLPVKRNVVAVSDGAGEVVAIGENVTRAKVGDRVVTSIFPHWIDGPFSIEYAAQLGGSLDGMLTEYAALHEETLVPVPDHLSYEEAATLPCAGVTAWNALTGGMPLLAGQSVLTLGSGGVSLFALQLAKLFGARVIATTSSEEKAASLRSLGADEVVNYCANPDWPAEVRRLTQAEGVNHIVEVGGGSTLEQSLKSVRIGGEIALVGSVAGGSAKIDANAIFAAAATLRGIAVGSRVQFENLASAITANRLRPVIDRVFAFDEAPVAFAFYAEGRNFGKVVIKIGL